MDEENIQVVKETYNAIAKFFAPILSIDNSSVAEVSFMDSFIARLPEKCDVVDLGCGVGKHGRYCASKGFKVTGYDISEKMIELAKSYNGQYTMKFLQVADMCTFQSNIKFDGAVAMYSFIHLTKEQAVSALHNLTKHLKDSAHIVLTVYHGERNGYYDEALMPGCKQFYRDYTEEELLEMISNVGFKVEDIQLWNDEDDITASNDDIEFGVIGVIATWQVTGNGTT